MSTRMCALPPLRRWRRGWRLGVLGIAIAAAACLQEPPGVESSGPPVEPTFTPVMRADGACEVTIVRVIEAREYQASGPSPPALEEGLGSDVPLHESYDLLGHGDHHIRCYYEVRLRSEPGVAYGWEVIHSNTARDLTPAVCRADAGRVAEEVIRSTKSCTDLDAGAYWGFALEPL